MQKIDAHQHFWQFDPIRDNWINEEMKILRRDFLAEDLQALLKANEFDGCVAIQSAHSENDNSFLLNIAEDYGFIKGIVGWVDFQADNINERLDYYSHIKKIKGFRHILDGEPNKALMLEPKFKNGINQLSKYGFTYDILILPDQLKFAEKLVSTFPNQKFVLDHLAKPGIKDGNISSWASDIMLLAKHENVWCKLSGMVSQADWHSWNNSTFRRYIDVVVGAFGPNRLMFGSDWPVCLVAGNYGEVNEVVSDYTCQLSKLENDLIFGGNATTFYNL